MLGSVSTRRNRARETLTAKVVGRAGDGSSDASLLYVVCGHRDDDGVVDGFAHGCFFSELSRGEHRGNGESGKWGVVGQRRKSGSVSRHDVVVALPEVLGTDLSEMDEEHGGHVGRRYWEPGDGFVSTSS